MVKTRFELIENSLSPDGKPVPDSSQPHPQQHKTGTNSNLSKDALEIAATLRTNTISKTVLDGFLRSADAGLIILTGVIASLYGASINVPSLWQVVALLEAAMIGVMLFQMADLYQTSTLQKAFSHLTRLVSAWALVFAALITSLLLFLPSAEIPQTILLSWFIGGAVALSLFRMTMRSLIVRWTRTGRLNRRAVLVGGGQAAADLIAELERQPNNPIEICGIFDDRDNDRSPASVAATRSSETSRT